MATDNYSEVIRSLKAYYDRDSDRRDNSVKTDWKIEERGLFAATLGSDALRLLEVGAGTGQDSLYFVEQGFDVVATDLSPAMVARCREKGLNALERDFLSLDFPDQSFDGIYALNCLLHVPTQTLPDVLQNFHRMLAPGGLLYIGMYGGEDESVIRNEPSGDRLFVSYSDGSLKQIVSQWFDIEHFRRVDFGQSWPQCFQSLILRNASHGLF